MHQSKRSIVYAFLAAVSLVSTAVAQRPVVLAHPIKILKPGSTDNRAGNDLESSSLREGTPANGGPISVTWHFKNNAGDANLTFNPNGTYLFSGKYKEKRPNKDFDISLALKGTGDEILIFNDVSDATNGPQFSNQGMSEILKEDYSLFAKKHQWYAEYHFTETSNGRRLAYEARKKKLERLRHEQEEARKRKDERLAAEKKAEAQRLVQQEIAQQQTTQQSLGGSSNGVGSTITDVVNGVKSVVSTLQGAFSDVAGFF